MNGQHNNRQARVAFGGSGVYVYSATLKFQSPWVERDRRAIVSPAMPKIRPRLPKARNSSRYDGRHAQNASKGHGRSRQIFQVGVAASRLWRRSKAGESERLKQTSSLLNFYPLPLGYGEKMEKKGGKEGEREAAAPPRAPHLNIKHTGGDKILAGGRGRQRRRLVFHGKNGQSCLNHDAAVRIASASSFVASPPPSQFGQLPVSRVVTRRRRRRRLRRRKRREEVALTLKRQTASSAIGAIVA